MSLRKDFVLKALAKEVSIAELCRELGVSRKTGHKWIRRFKERGTIGLVDESRRPDSSPLAISAELVLDVIELRKAHGYWGPKKLRALLARRLGPDQEPPAVATIARVLKRAGLHRPRRKRGISFAPKNAPVVVVEGPNDLWTVDFKGWWCTQDGVQCWPLTIRDAHSRFVLALTILKRARTEEVRQVFEALFKKHGLPKAILSDNGQPFACVRALGGLSQLSAWWVSLGIKLVRSRPGKPQDNGAHERMHSDIRLELQAHKAANPTRQQTACDAWRDEFNHVRPHEALGQRTPGEFYKPSKRRIAAIVVGGYPEDTTMRKLSAVGVMTVQKRKIYVAKALRGLQVALEATGTGDYRVWFYDLLLGQFTPGEHDRVLPPAPEPCNPEIAPRGDTVATRVAARKPALPTRESERKGVKPGRRRLRRAPRAHLRPRRASRKTAPF